MCLTRIFWSFCCKPVEWNDENGETVLQIHPNVLLTDINGIFTIPFACYCICFRDWREKWYGAVVNGWSFVLTLIEKWSCWIILFPYTLSSHGPLTTLPNSQIELKCSITAFVSSSSSLRITSSKSFAKTILRFTLSTR